MLARATPFMRDLETLHRAYYPRVHSQLIAIMERLVRAIAMQFTLGDHADQSGRLRQTSPVYSDFRNLRDEQLGTIDYRRSVRILEQDKENWTKRPEDEIVGGEWPPRGVTKTEFGGEWPFRADRVIIECRDDMFCIVNVDGYAFALNGAAKSHFRLPFPPGLLAAR